MKITVRNTDGRLGTGIEAIEYTANDDGSVSRTVRTRKPVVPEKKKTAAAPSSVSSAAPGPSEDAGLTKLGAPMQGASIPVRKARKPNSVPVQKAQTPMGPPAPVRTGRADIDFPVFSGGKLVKTPGTETPLNSPSAVQRAGKTLSGAGKTYAGSMAGFGGWAAETLAKLDESVSTQHKRAKQDEKAIQDYQTMLQRGSWNNGVPLTGEDRQKIALYIKNAQNRIRVDREYQDKIHAPLTAASEFAYQTGERWSQAGQADIEQAKTGLGAVGRFAVDAGVAGAQMAADFAPALLTGGGSALVPMFFRSAGGAALTGKESGADFANRTAYALGSGALSVATEQISNVAGPFRKMFGAGVADKIAGRLVERFGEKQAVQIMNRAAQSAAGRVALSAFGEGFEEVAEAFLQAPLQRSTINPDARFDKKEAAYEGLIGAALGGLGGAGGIVQQQIRERAGQRAHTAAGAAGQSQLDPNAFRAQDAGKPPQTNHPAWNRNAQDAAPGTQGPAAEARTRSGNAMPEQSWTRNPDSPAIPETDPLWQIIRNIQAEQTGPKTERQTRQEAVRDAVERLVPPGQHMDTSALSQADFDLLADASADGTLGVDAAGRVFRVSPEDHIDQRQTHEMGSRNINAFQFDHPELHSFFSDAAQAFLSDLGQSTKGGVLDIVQPDQHARVNSTDDLKPTVRRSSRVTSGALAELLDSGMSYARIEKALNAIIHDEGQENYADAKRVELALDRALTYGYEGLGYELPPNQAYIDAKGKIAGAVEIQAPKSYETGPDGFPVVPEEDELPLSLDDGLGAADAGSLNSDYDRLQAQSSDFHPEGANPARPVDVPRTDFDGRDVSKTASTVMGAAAIPDDVVPMIEQMVADGRLSYNRAGDRAALEWARARIQSSGFEGAVAEYRDAVTSGRLSKNIDVMGQLLISNAANAGDGNLTAELISLYQASGTNAAQIIQARNIFRKLTPESQLYGLQRAVSQMNTEIAERRGRNRNLEISEAAYSALQRSYQEALDAYRNLVGTMRDAYEQADQAERETPDWVSQLARDLAAGAESRALPRTQGQRTIYSTLLSDLNAIMRARVDSNHTRPEPRSAIDRIADLFANREEYSRAWEAAREQLRTRYRNNPAALDALRGILNTSLYQGGQEDGAMDAALFRAVAEAALDSDTSIREIVMRGEYEPEALADQFTGTLVERTGVSGGDAEILRDAVRAYIRNRTENAGRSSAEYLHGDIQRTLRSIGARMSEIIRSRPGSRGALLGQITQALVNEYHISPEAAPDIARDIAQDFQNQISERSRAALERTFREQPRRAVRALDARFEELINLGAFAPESEFSRNAVRKLFGVQEDVSIPQELIQKFLDQSDQEGRDAVMTEIAEDLANQIPPTRAERFRSWRYLGMLANPTTHIRNVAGNLIMDVLGRRVKNLLGAGMEHIAVRDQEQRAKSVLNPLSQQDRALRQFAREQYGLDQSIAMGQRKYTDGRGGGFRAMIRENQKTLPGPAQKAADWNTAALDYEDLWFNRGAYVDSLAQALKAKGITAGEAASGQKAELVEQARAYAIQEAQKATYRDANAFSEFISSLGRTGDRSNPFTRALSFGVDVRFPFRRTPADVLVRGIEYSPAGLVKAVTSDLGKVRSGNMTASEMIDHLSSGMTGSAIFGLGMFLAAQGLLSLRPGGDDKRERDFLKDAGFQDFAVNFAGKTFALSWLGAAALPLFAGAAMMESCQMVQQEDGNGWDAAGNACVSLFQACASITDAIMETSMLQSFKELLDGFGYADSKPWYLLSSTIMDFLEQNVPTVLSKAASAFDDTVRSSYVPSGTPEAIEDSRYFLQGLQRKIPVARNQMQPKIDLWGQEVSNGGKAERVLKNFISPGAFGQAQLDKLGSELMRLKDATGSSAVLPEKVEKSFKVGDETKYLTAEEYTRYARTVGQTRRNILSSLVEHEGYQKLSDKDKAKTIQAIYEYAAEIGKMEVSDYKPDQGTLNILNHPNLNKAPYFVYKRMMAVEDANQKAGQQSGAQANANVRNAIKNDSSLTPKEKNLLDDWIISDIAIIDKKLDVDYASDETFAISQMSDSAQKHWNYVQERTGISLQDYKTAWSICSSTEKGYHKTDRINDLMDQLGVSKFEASQIYKACKKTIEDDEDE